MRKSSENLDRLILSGVTDGLLAVDRDFRCIRWNPVMETISGLKEVDVLGREVFVLCPFLKKIEEDRLFEQAMAGQSIAFGAWEFSIPGTGRSVFFEGNCSPLKDLSGEIIGVISIIRDVSERALAAKESAESAGPREGEERFRTRVNSVQNIIWAADETGRNIFTNQFGLKFLGLDKDRTQIDNWMPVTHPEDVPLAWKSWAEAFQSGRPFQAQLRMKRAVDGCYRWMLTRALPIRDSFGRIIEWVGTTTEIHAQVIGSQRAQELQEITAELSSAVTPAQVAGIFFSRGLVALGGKSAVMVLLTSDRHYAEIFASCGVPESIISEWKRFPLSMCVPVTDTIRCRRPTYLHSLEHARERYPLVVPVMEILKEQAHASLPLIIENEVMGVLSIGFAECRYVDEDEERYMLTLAGLCAQAFERSRIYEAERVARAMAESANIAKSSFLATVSHEIRTPLCSIIGFSELLLRPNLAQAQRQSFVQGIDRNGKALIRLVDDILDLSKIEAGKLSIEKVEFHLPSCLHEVAEALRQGAERKGIGFSFTLSPEAPRRIFSDPLRLRQIFFNIVGNAIKFTDTGSVNVTMTHEGEAEAKTCDLVFRVKDTGIGLKDEDHDLLFQPFGQVSESSSRRSGGTGLGLVIARNLAQKLGGDARLVSSVPGKGSVFEFRISAEAVTKESMVSPAAGRELRSESHGVGVGSLKGVRILVAEDAPDIQAIVAMILADQGADVDVVANGQEAIEKALQASYELIVMDLQMPVVDGYEATKHLRDSGYTQPIIGLTANALGDFRKSLQSGFNAHILKPIDTTLFLQTVYDFAGSGRATPKSH